MAETVVQNERMATEQHVARQPDVARRPLFRATAVRWATRAAHERPVDHLTATTVRVALAPWQLDRIFAHIEENLAETLRNAHLARLIFLSTSQFSRAFSASVGISPAQYILRRRIEFACRLMISTKMSLCQIAIACGLCDQAHFCRTFRRFFSETPRGWRRANARSVRVEERL